MKFENSGDAVPPTFISATTTQTMRYVHLFQEWNSPDESILRVKGMGLLN
jgi:hypothetical protein